MAIAVLVYLAAMGVVVARGYKQPQFWVEAAGLFGFSVGAGIAVFLLSRGG